MNIKIGNLFKGDKVVWMILFLLCMVSIVEVFSASSVLTYKSQNYLKPISFHSFTIVVGVIVAIIMQNIPYNRYRSMIPFLTVFSAVTLLWVLLAGAKVGDAGRWISIFGLTFQPSEIAKGTIVLLVSQILAMSQRENGADKSAIKVILWITIPTCILIGLENLSTAVMLFGVVFMMMFFGLVPIKQLVKLAGYIILIIAFVLAIIMLVGHDISDEDKELERTDETILEPLSGTDWPRDMPVVTGGGLVESVATIDVAYASSGGDDDNLFTEAANNIPIIQADMSQSVARTFGHPAPLRQVHRPERLCGLQQSQVRRPPEQCLNHPGFRRSPHLRRHRHPVAAQDRR